MIRELGPDGDILGGRFITGSPMVAQNVAGRIQLWARENPFDLDEGIDWKNEIKADNQSKIITLINDVVITTPGVSSITGSSIEPGEGGYNVVISIITVYSSTVVVIEEFI